MIEPDKTLLKDEQDYLNWIKFKIKENNYDVAFTEDPEKFPCVAILLIDDNDVSMSSSGMAYSTFIYEEDFKNNN
jgi:hypothetical protein